MTRDELEDGVAEIDRACAEACELLLDTITGQIGDLNILPTLFDPQALISKRTVTEVMGVMVALVRLAARVSVLTGQFTGQDVDAFLRIARGEWEKEAKKKKR